MTSGTITVDAAPETEPVSVEEAKRHLRIMSLDFDTEIGDAVAAAREWCEQRIGRTLRSDVTRTQRFYRWPKSPLILSYPPLRSVVSIKYYDEADVDQTLAVGNYRVYLSTTGLGYIEWDSDAVLPGTSTREDAVRIEYKAGYVNGLIPPAAKQAILLVTAWFWGDGSGRDLASTERAAKALLDAVDWGSYS